MTLQEILKNQGLTDEQIEAVIGEMKQNKIYTTNEENIDIRYNKLKADHDSLTAQHGESTKLIEQLKKDAGANEALQGKTDNSILISISTCSLRFSRPRTLRNKRATISLRSSISMALSPFLRRKVAMIFSPSLPML